jgi:Ca2+-binding EF-hand superfamily protein
VAVLSKADVLSAIAERPEIDTEEVECPELKGSILVREMTGTVRNRIEAAFAAIGDGADGAIMDKVLVSLVSACVVDPSGRQFITRDMAEKMLKNHPRAVFRIRDAVVKISALDESDAEEMAESFG